MTKSELREAVKREGRIKSGTNLDTMVDDIILDILTDFCNLARYYELLQENTPITLVDEQQAYSLPDDFQHIAAIRYGRGADPTTFRMLKEQTPTVSQTYSGGYPVFYRLVAGPKISLFPYSRVVAADQLFLDYYADPRSLFSDDADAFPIPRLESAVKKAAIARVQRFMSSSTEAQMTERDSGSSFNASNAAG